METPHATILFDGVCNLCNGFVQFVIRHDTRQQFKFASLQSDVAKALLKDFPQSGRLDSVVLFENGLYFRQSTAALRVLRRLSIPWSLLYVFIILPAFVRDWAYNWVAKNRYCWFGQNESCMLPTPELRSRFL